jgi:hypothetical protein
MYAISHLESCTIAHEFQSEPYDFSYLIFISRTYKLSPEEEEKALESPSSNAPSSKRQKGSKKAVSQTPPDGIYSFHPEDSCVMRVRGTTKVFSVTDLLYLAVSSSLFLSVLIRAKERQRCVWTRYQPPNHAHRRE